MLHGRQHYGSIMSQTGFAQFTSLSGNRECRAKSQSVLMFPGHHRLRCSRNQANAGSSILFGCMEEPMNAIQRCAACGESFKLRPQSPTQSYCSSADCQRERRRQWQKSQLRNDLDYRDNQARAQAAWRERNSDYWRRYREEHPDYQESNRQAQRIRNEKRGQIAKMDSSTTDVPVPSGIYTLCPVTAAGIAKMNVWTVQITVLARLATR
jgi:hypothetical protein